MDAALHLDGILSLRCVCNTCSFIFLFWMTYLPEALLITLYVPCQVQLQTHFGHPNPDPSQHPYTLPRIPVLASTACEFPSGPRFWSEVFTHHASLLPFFPHFLHLGIESSCVLYSVLKDLPALLRFLVLRVISQEILLTNCLNSWI